MAQFETLQQMLLETAEILKPPERLTVSEAAEKYRYVNVPGAYVGPWKNSTTPYMVEPMDMLNSREHNSVIFAGPAQCGKALDINTPLATPTGWTTMGDIAVGDTLFDETGKQCRVVFRTQVMRDHDCYEIEFCDGTRIVADAEHRWAVDDIHGNHKVITTDEIAEKFKAKASNSKGWRSRYAIPVQGALQTEPVELPIDPYFLGVWLGDGKSTDSSLFLNADDIDICEHLMQLGFKLTIDHDSQNCFRVRLFRSDEPPMVSQLKELGVHRNKHIPPIYLRAGTEQRRELLRGLMDTDGSIDQKGRCEFTSSFPDLAKDAKELITSLGFKVSETVQNPWFTYKGERRRGKPNHRLTFFTYDDNLICHVDRKQRMLRSASDSRPSQTKRRWIRDVRPVDSVPVRCIQVDSPNHLFLAGRQMVPTHNTDALLANWHLYNVICDPADMIFYQTAQGTAKDFSRRRVDRLHRHSPEVGKRLIPRREADSVYTKLYRAGNMLTLSWPSINELSGRPVGRVALTDVDRMPENIDGEGSPFDLGRKRTTTFGSFAMTLAESSPGFSVEDPKWRRLTPHQAPPCPGILALYNRGDRRRWQWPCIHCGEFYEPNFSLLTWPDSNDLMECGDNAEMACPHCGGLMNHDDKSDVNRKGVWVPDGMKVDKTGKLYGKPYRSDIASYWLKGVAASFASWKTLVVNYLKAEQEFERTGSQEALKSTINTDQGEPYTPRGMTDARLAEDLIERAKPLGEKVVPDDVRCLIATIDVQKNAFVCQVHGVKPQLDLVVIDRFEIRKSERLDDDGERYWVSPATYLEDWLLITEKVINRTYPLADDSGRNMQVKFTCCDSGGRDGVATNAYNYYRQLKKDGLSARFILVKGDGRKDAPRVRKTFPDSQRKDRNAGARGEIPVLMLNTDTLKDWLNSMLDRLDPGGGLIEFPDWLSDSFFNELVAENRDHKGWQNPRGQRNESWDLLVYCLALLVHLKMEKINWDEPPLWLEEWDNNSLVTEGEQPKFNTRSRRERRRLSDLAQVLA